MDEINDISLSDLTLEQQFAMRQMRDEIGSAPIDALRRWLVDVILYQMRYQNFVKRQFKVEATLPVSVSVSVPSHLSAPALPERIKQWRNSLQPHDGVAGHLAARMLAATHDAVTDPNAHLYWVVAMDEWERLTQEKNFN